MRNSLSIAVLFLLVRLLGLAQLQPSSDPGEAASDGGITVDVRSSQGVPLPGALVMLSGHTTGQMAPDFFRRSVANADGLARFSLLPNANYRIEARMAGYSLHPGSTLSIDLLGSEARGKADITLRRRPVMSGRVTDERGVPVYDATVRAFRLETRNGEEHLAADITVTTDDRGIYRIVTDTPGRYSLRASHADAVYPRGSAPLLTADTFYPNSIDLLTAAPVEAAFDRTMEELDISLARAPDTALTIQVRSGPQGRPCPRCRLGLRRIEGKYEYELSGDASKTSSRLNYQRIPAGLYRVYVEDTDDHEGWWAIAETAVVEGQPTEVTVSTNPPIQVSGRITLEDPPLALLEEFRDRPDAVRIIMGRVRAPHPFFAPAVNRAEASVYLRGGEFSMETLPPGKYRPRITVFGTTDYYISRLARSGRPVNSAVFDLTRPGTWTDLDVRVRFDPAEPDIRMAEDAISQEGSTGHRLALIPDGERNPFARYFETTCGTSGRCYTVSRPPGRYWAIILPGSKQDGPDPRVRAVREKLEAWGTYIDLIPGKNSPVQLRPAPARLLDGI